MQDAQSSKNRITTQLWLGVLCATLEFGLYFLYQNLFNPLPLYMDTLFTTAASFFGPISGCICAFLFHTICISVFQYPIYNFAWSICSFSVVLIIRLYVSIRKKSIGKKIEILDIVLLVFIVALIISIEGALIFTILNFAVNYTEDSQVRFMFAFLSSNNVSTFISALLPRVPVNILDKGICVTLGYFAYKGMKKLFNRKR